METKLANSGALFLIQSRSKSVAEGIKLTVEAISLQTNQTQVAKQIIDSNSYGPRH